MLSASISTLEALSSDTSNNDSGSQGTDATWFDLFGRVLAVFELHTLFALSVALLVAAPLLLIVVGAVLYRLDKLYIFSRRKQIETGEDVESVPLHGWKGFFQLPVLLVPASAAVVGLAYLMKKENPFIVYSSPYAVWSMTLSAWFFIAWFLSCSIDFLRPSALTRLYSLLWLFVVGWIILVAVTVTERRQKIAGGYFIVFHFTAIFLATLLALVEFFGLPRKSQYAEEVNPLHVGGTPNHRSQSISSGHHLAQPSDVQQRPEDSEHDNAEEDEEATERTSLLRNDRQTTFAHYHHQDADAGGEHALEESKERKVYVGEQAWSWSLPSWLWVLEFLLLSVIPIILTGEIALFLTSSVHQTLADGSSILLPYIAIALFTILVLVPVSPFIHRYTYHIPIFLLLIFIGTLVYNLLAFPFSANNRLKVYFNQRVDLDTGINTVSLTGIKDGPYLRRVAASLPSTAGQDIICTDSKNRLGLQECIWHGLPPKVIPSPPPHLGIPPQSGYADWLSFNVTHANATRNEAHITLFGKNTRACKLQFDTPISDFWVEGAIDDDRFEKVPKEGSKEIRLWSRTWEKPWNVRVLWHGGDSNAAFSSRSRKQQRGGRALNGEVVCLWSDANESGVIPALDEVWRYAPTWATVSKNSDGLVEGSRSFLI